ERYTKFVKERADIELSYAKQIRNLSKKYQPKKSREEESRYTWCLAFVTTLRELSDSSSQREALAENLHTHIVTELSRYIQELKAERKSHFQDGRRAQQHMENSWKQLESVRSHIEPRHIEPRHIEPRHIEPRHIEPRHIEPRHIEPRHIEPRHIEPRHIEPRHIEPRHIEPRHIEPRHIEPQHIEPRHIEPQHIEPRHIRIQDMEERRIERVGEAMRTLAEVERKVLPLTSRCLDGMTEAAESVQPRVDTRQVVEMYKSGFEPPGDVEFEDYSATMRRSISESSYLDSRAEGRRHSRKLWPFIRKNKGSAPEDCSHLPPEQRRKKLQTRISNINREIQREREQRDALLKMREVYERSPEMGDAGSLEPRMDEVKQSLERLEEELHRNQGWLVEAESRLAEHSRRRQSGGCGPDGSYTEDHSAELHFKSRSSEFDDDFDDEEPLPSIGTCKSLYPFQGQNEGTISMVEGELLSVVEEDKGDGWTRVRRNHEEEGYVPTSYIKVFLDSNAKGAMTYI
uniref:Formin binding protein 1a n=1 Tax=Myripristis murdjan TaxID=586833 RepID=A0A667YUZ8_9TELE